MPVSLAFDLTRLITRIRHASPTGIDRVDLAYARRYLASEGLVGDGPRFGLVSSPFGPRIVDRDTALGIVEAVAAGWIEDVQADDDPVYVRTAARLGAGTSAAVPTDAGKPAASRAEALRRLRLQVASLLKMVPAGGPERLPPGTIYLHTSHLRLDRPGRFDWLYTRPDVKPVFFVHDLIPISNPEFGRHGEAARHAVRMGTVARHARHVVVNSAEVGERFAEHVAAQGFGPRPVTASWLGVEPVFFEREPVPRFERPVFLVCGTIEARKNHLLLLHIWRNLAARLGPDTPRLVIVGRRGWEAENVFDMLDRGHLHDSVMEVRGLTTPGLARLMRGATALLMPSFIEGYGLPVVEAAASGLPVVASDIAVHREIGGAFAHLLDPLDGPGWTDAIEALGRPASPLRADLGERLARVAAPTWQRHFERVDAVLDALGEGPGSARAA